MFNFVLVFKMDFNKTRSLLVSFLTLRPQQQWKHFKIVFHNMISQRIQFPFKSDELVP
jgi:hypothetical protein